LLLWPYRLAAGVDTPIEMIYTAPQEFLFTEMKLALFGAFFLAFPVLASQIYMFVAPDFIVASAGLSCPSSWPRRSCSCSRGARLFRVMPLAMKFFLSMQQTGPGEVHIQLTAKVSEYLSLIMTLILGSAFASSCRCCSRCSAAPAHHGGAAEIQTPRAILIAFIVAAVLTPPDP